MSAPLGRMATYFAMVCRACGDLIQCEAEAVVAHAEIATFTAAHVECGADIELRIEAASPAEHRGYDRC